MRVSAMRRQISPTTRILLLAALIANLSDAQAQQSPKKPANQSEDIIRVTTELVQTDVTVFDKQGRFVDGLRPEQFQLSLDGKQQPISFFEQVTTGSAREAALAATAGK